MQLHIRDASKIHRSGEQAPVAILATHLIDDISDLCVRMAIINHHELWPGEAAKRREDRDQWQWSDD